MVVDAVVAYAGRRVGYVDQTPGPDIVDKSVDGVSAGYGEARKTAVVPA